MVESVQSAFGICVFVALAWIASEDRRAVPWRTVVSGIGLQLVVALALLELTVFRDFFLALNDGLLVLERATEAGTSFVFGYLGGGDAPFEVTAPGSSFILAFRALPLILVVSALSALLFHWRVLQVLVRFVSSLLQKSMGVGGALGVGTAANVFVGMVEAPLLIRPYLGKMSRGELFALMTCGMATIAGTVMVLYASILGQTVPGAMGHILAASLISAPASVAIAGLLVPPGPRRTGGELLDSQPVGGSMDALTQGTLQGLQLFLNILAMLVVFVALVSLVNSVLGLLPEVSGEPVTLQRILGVLMAPLVWAMGVPWVEAQTAGMLMGTKTVLNELLAYLEMARLDAGLMSERSRIIMTYALCGFANLGSLGIMLGGLGTMIPERRQEIAALGLKSIAAGTLATMMTGAVVGVVMH